MEALNKRIFPRAPWFNVERLAVVVTQAFLEGVVDKLMALVAAQVIGSPSDQEQSP